MNIFEEAHQKYLGSGTKSNYVVPGLLAMIAEDLQRLNQNIEDLIAVHADADTEKTQTMKEIEQKFGKPINELLFERKDKSIREIAEEFEISKSAVAKWRNRIF